MIKYILFVTIASINFYWSYAQPLFQKKTATFLNNLNTFRRAFGDQNYHSARAGDVALDDDVYGCSVKLKAIEDSATPFRFNSISVLALQGFGFTIPENATIDKIELKIRRFKNGGPSIGDLSLTVMQRFACPIDTPCINPVFWTFLDEYAGKIYPETETEFVFSQDGSGTNGGFNHDQAYQWTPALVNHQFFGVRIENYPPIGRGTVSVCYDFVELTVYYTPPATIAGKPNVATETLKKPIIYPNPFTAKTNIQFTAAESGNAVVELYNMNGAKVRTLFSGIVVQGQAYQVTAGDARLPKGIYMYVISNGKQKQTGRIIKME